ncbi:putative Ig domain-containing protein [Sphingobacterium sp. SG20118]|uniref:putative Ig domain-containing protein n=1 Tax=Sphingobacterium sp. SG20118 TaxID=3367156 RepID=UPI0037DFC696
MTKIILPLILLLTSCKLSTDETNYFGQTYPGSIPEIFAPGIVSVKGRLEHGISFTPDAKELAFGVLNEDDFSGVIFHSKRIKEKWTELKIFEPLKNQCVYLPYFSPNGKSLLYTQSKSDTDNVYTDVWIIEKINDEWVFPKKIAEPLNSTSREANACMTSDGTIYFSSNRNCDEKKNCHTADLFYSKIIDNEYSSVNVISEFISTNDEESVFISPREDYIIFCRYTDNETGVDLYISYRDINNNWIEPQIVDSTINSKDWDRRPFVSIDNKFLFFTRLQIAEKGLTESDIFWVNTSKLFKPFVYHSPHDITVQVGEEFEISIPKDYFKDIDDKQLTYKSNHNQFDWLHFDSEQMKLSGNPTVGGVFELTFTAIDKSSNLINDKILITVTNLRS